LEKTAEVALLLADDKEKHGGQGWNRTSDTGIFRACKINNLLIMMG